MANNANFWPKIVLFDLDGTLIDSAPDLRASTNILLSENNFGPLTLDQVRSMIGNGVAKLVERAFAASGETLDDGQVNTHTDRMMSIYSKHLTVETRLMNGAVEALQHCKAIEAATGVVTNKPETATRSILAHFDLTDDINVVVGGDTGPMRKPAPDMLLHAVAQLGLSCSDALMVGDSPADIDAAKAADIRSIAVRGGYTNVAAEDLGADIVIDSLSELVGAIQEMMTAA